MKTWYCVVTAYDDRGRVTAAIVDTKESEDEPESSYTSTTRKDIYMDWFGSQEEAQEHVKEALAA